jgi:hypothetical protein
MPWQLLATVVISQVACTEGTDPGPLPLGNLGTRLLIAKTLEAGENSLVSRLFHSSPTVPKVCPQFLNVLIFMVLHPQHSKTTLQKPAYFESAPEPESAASASSAVSASQLISFYFNQPL